MSKELELSQFVGEGVSEEEATQITEKIEQIVEARTDAKLEIEKELIESEVKEKYDTILAEKTEEFTSKVTSLEETFIAKAEEFRTNLTEETQTTVEEFKTEKEQEMETFVEGIIEKLDEYLDLEVSKAIPADAIETSAKVAVLEPIVNGFKSVMEENYIRFDEEQFGLLKESREEILNLRGQLAETVEESMALNKKLKNVARDVNISKVCEGLTESQRERAVKLLEGVDASEIESRFSMIRDMVIVEETDSTDDVITEEVQDSVELEEKSFDKVVSEDADLDEDLDQIDEDVEQPVDEIEEYANIFKNMQR
jgi:hypothetical protein